MPLNTCLLWFLCCVITFFPCVSALKTFSLCTSSSAYFKIFSTQTCSPASSPPSMSYKSKTVLEAFPLGRGPFRTFDPFLFCVYHHDMFPVGELSMGPNPRLLRGRDLGMDFSYQDGWSMYHGETIPGFPEHPHRGFETITVVRNGLVDHSDSMKCTARYGNGDTQWMTAGKGIQHSEMFPLVNMDRPNPLRLFQIWLNLPKVNKMCEPYFSMMWDEATPRTVIADPATGKETTVTVIAGALNGTQPLSPPPDSWASRREADVAVWVLDIPAGATVSLPPAQGGASTTRAIYLLDGKGLRVGDEQELAVRTGARVVADVALTLKAADAPAEALVLQGRPIGEPVAQRGPFVMNTQEEILQCFDDFRRTQFGGWPWGSSDHTHSRETPRHATRGTDTEYPPNKPAS